MCRRRWFIGILSYGISFAVRLPWLSSLSMENDWIYEKGKENCYRVLTSGEERRKGASEVSKFRRTRIMLRISGRFLPPQAEEEEAAAEEGEHDADDDAVCRSIRPTMSGRTRRRG